MTPKSYGKEKKILWHDLMTAIWIVTVLRRIVWIAPVGILTWRTSTASTSVIRVENTRQLRRKRLTFKSLFHVFSLVIAIVLLTEGRASNGTANVTELIDKKRRIWTSKKLKIMLKNVYMWGINQSSGIENSCDFKYFFTNQTISKYITQ